MKIVGISILRTGKDVSEPIPLVVVQDLSSYGFFQRQVRIDQMDQSICNRFYLTVILIKAEKCCMKPISPTGSEGNA